MLADHPLSSDAGAGRELEDKVLEGRWQVHHQERAVLRPALKRVNLSDLRPADGPGTPAL